MKLKINPIPKNCNKNLKTSTLHKIAGWQRSWSPWRHRPRCIERTWLVYHNPRSLPVPEPSVPCGWHVKPPSWIIFHQPILLLFLACLTVLVFPVYPALVLCQIQSEVRETCETFQWLWRVCFMRLECSTCFGTVPRSIIPKVSPFSQSLRLLFQQTVIRLTFNLAVCQMCYQTK